MTPKKSKSRRSQPAKNVGDRIIDGLTELRDVLRAGAPLEERFTVRTVDVPEPEEFDAIRVRKLRERLGMSQHIFAKLIGVSTVLVQSWEQRVRSPSPLARRLLAEIDRDPSRWQQMIVRAPTAAAQGRRRSA